MPKLYQQIARMFASIVEHSTAPESHPLDWMVWECGLPLEGQVLASSRAACQDRFDVFLAWPIYKFQPSFQSRTSTILSPHRVNLNL